MTVNGVDITRIGEMLAGVTFAVELDDREAEIFRLAYRYKNKLTSRGYLPHHIGGAVRRYLLNLLGARGVNIE